jgi:predicted Zn-dependent protease
MTKAIALFFILILITHFAFAQEKQKEQSDEEIGARTFQIVKESMGIYKNGSVLKEVTSVGRSLEKFLGLTRPLKYFLVDSSEPNAFATAGGYVYVTRGLLAIVNTQDELAGIMAHELSHVVLKHSTKSMKAGIVPAILQLPVRLIGTLTSPAVADLINIPIGFASHAALAAYSRGQERAADEHGVGVAIQAGYKPYGLVDGLERLTTYVEFLSGKPMEKNLFTDHPMTDKRVKELTSRLEKKGFKRTPYFEGTDLSVIEGMIYGQNPQGGILDTTRFIHPAIGLYFEFPKTWYAQNSPTSLAIVAPDKQSALIIAVDTASATPEAEAKKSAEKMRRGGLTILVDEPYSRNGLHGYRVQVGDDTRAAELRWITTPSGAMLKVIGITAAEEPSTELMVSMNSFRPSTAHDLSSFNYHTVDLKDASDEKTMADYVDSGDKASQAELLEILNGVAPGQGVRGGKFVKTIRTRNLAFK